MTTPTAAERAYDLIYRALVMGEPCEAELTDLFKKADERDKYADQLGEIIFAVLESGREVQLYPKDKSAVEIVKAALIKLKTENEQLKHTAKEMAREAVVLRKAYDKIKPKAEAFDCVFDSFMRSSNGYNDTDPQFRWLIELPMTNKEHDTLLEAINKAKGGV